MDALRADRQFMDAVRRGGAKWGTAQVKIATTLPDTMVERVRYDEAYAMVKPVLVRLFGEENIGWKTERRDQKVWIRAVR